MNDGARCEKAWSCLICISKLIKCLGGVALGVGTLFLGLAAYYKSSEIYDVILKIKDLGEVVQEIKVLSNTNNKLLTELAANLKADTPQNKVHLSSIVSAISPWFSSCAVSPGKTENEKIIDRWSSLPSDDDREQYLLNLFKGNIKCESHEEGSKSR